MQSFDNSYSAFIKTTDILARRRRRKISVFFGVFDVFPYQGEFPCLFKQNHEFTEPGVHKRMVGCWFCESETQN